jgi:hypothetical protein
MEPIYRSDGEWVAVYERGHLFTTDGEWLGFVAGRRVFSTAGEYLGFLSDDRRLLRRRHVEEDLPRRPVPPRPTAPQIPISVPLAPLLRELPFHIIDVFEEEGGRLLFVSETRPDME